MKLTDTVRDQLVAICTEDTADALARDADFRVHVAKHGFTGFAQRPDTAVVRAFHEARLDERHPGLEIPAPAPDTDPPLNDASVDPLTPEQTAVVRACLGYFQAADHHKVYQTVQGHIVDLELPARRGDGTPRIGGLTCQDLVFLASFGARVRWIEAHTHRLTLGL